MVQWVKDLLELQNVDMRIRGLELRQTMVPKEIANLKNSVISVDGELKGKRDDLNKTTLEIKQLESQIKQKNEHISKLMTQSSMVKKNTEYQAMMKEIEDVKAGISDLETQMIELFDKSDDNSTISKEAEKQAKAQKQSIEDEVKELEQLIGEIKGEIVKQHEARIPLAAKLDTDVLNRYNRLLKANGIPLVRIENGICGHCHLRVIPQTLHEVNKGAVTVCENCGHLVYA